MTQLDSAKLYEHSLTVYLRAKKEFKLHAGDTEPDPKDFGIEPFLAGKLKERVEREINRAA